METSWYIFDLLTSGNAISFDGVAHHGINALIAVIDAFITGMPIRVLHFYLPILFGIAYGIFSVSYDFAGGTNPSGSPYIYSVSK